MFKWIPNMVEQTFCHKPSCEICSIFRKKEKKVIYPSQSINEQEFLSWWRLHNSQLKHHYVHWVSLYLNVGKPIPQTLILRNLRTSLLQNGSTSGDLDNFHYLQVKSLVRSKCLGRHTRFHNVSIISESSLAISLKVFFRALVSFCDDRLDSLGEQIF